MKKTEMKAEKMKTAAKTKQPFRRESLLEFLCIVPALILIIAIAYYPIVDLFRISFTNWNLIKPHYDYVGLTNWKWLFEQAQYNHVFESFVVMPSL